MDLLYYRPDGTIDYERHAEQARQRKADYLAFQREWENYHPKVSNRYKRRLKGFGAAFALATLAFWATMATAPPTLKAASPEIGVQLLNRAAPLNLPNLVADTF